MDKIIDKKSPPKADPPLAGRIFFLVFLLLIIGSVAVTYYRIMIKKDYVVETQNDCDPYTEACFVWECNPESDVEGEACTGDPENDIWYYKINKRNASRIPLCDPNADENCQPWTCEPGEAKCEEILCDEKTAAEQEVSCNDPVKYTKENPIKEEAAECEDLPADEAGGDEACAAEEEVGADEAGDAADPEAEEREKSADANQAADNSSLLPVASEAPSAANQVKNILPAE